MKTRTLLVAGAAALAVAAPALAKGPSHATLGGPGIDGAIAVPGSGEPGGVSPLGRLVTETGFFAGTFGQTPDPMLGGRPKGDLGPRYTVAYRMPGPNNETDVIRQDLYPHAPGGPVSYMEPGQPFFGTEKTRGGWFRGSPSLTRTLREAGLPPASAPATASRAGNDSGSWPLSGPATGGLAAIGLALLAAGALVVVRRRPRAIRAA